MGNAGGIQLWIGQLIYSCGYSLDNNNDNNRIERRTSRSFTISSLRGELYTTRMLKWPRNNQVQITCSAWSAYHMRPSCATWYEGTAQLLS